MKHLKTFAVAALAVAALTASAVPAAATTLTSPAGTNYTSTLELKAQGKFLLDGTFPIECTIETIEAKIESHGASVTAAGPITRMEGYWCNREALILKRGSLEIHTDTANADGNGRLTWTDSQLTTSGKLLGFPVHCIYTLSNVNLGTITGSKNTGGTALVDGGTSKVAVHGSSLCQSEATGASNEWTGANYKITTPDYLDVD